MNLPLSLLGNFPKFLTEGIFSFTFSADKKIWGRFFLEVETMKHEDVRRVQEIFAVRMFLLLD